MAADAQQRIDAYLGRLRTRLRGVNEEDLREIVEELRSHILDTAGANGALSPGAVDAALARFGTPEELASQYLTDNLLARAEASRSPLQILRSLFRWGSLSVAGLFVLLGSVTGYFLGGAFLVVALLKPFHPQSAGLWAWRDGTGDLALSLSSTRVRGCSGWKPRGAGMVDRADRARGGGRARDADNARRALVRASLPPFARAAYEIV